MEQDTFDRYFTQWEARIGAFLEHRPPGEWAPVLKNEGGPQGNVLPGSPEVEARAPLAGMPFGVKDNIAVEGFHLTCGSRLLEQYRAPYTATAVERLLRKGAVPVGKTNLDEFGMGSSTDNSALKQTNNPWDIHRVAGGSSGGSAAAVAAGLVPFALGSDTGGSVRQPAAFCGVVGLKPTYGAVSRYGLVAYASSLEAIGILADTVDRAFHVFQVIRGPDSHDMTTMVGKGPEHCTNPDPVHLIEEGLPPVPAPESIRIGYIDPPLLAETLARAGESLGTGPTSSEKELSLQNFLEQEVIEGFEETIGFYRSLGYVVEPVTIPSLSYAVAAYYTIATAEASANLARFDGIRYGMRPGEDILVESPEDLVRSSRRSGFGDEVKLRILLGTFVLRSGFQDRYYHRAQEIRQQIRREFDAVLARYGAILLPVFPRRAFGRSEAGLSSFAQKVADVFTCAANLAGLPALAFPVGVKGGLPVGMQFMGAPFSEEILCGLAKLYGDRQGYPHPAGYQSFWR
ncbi:MAG: aspartyl/glutamyl-tRNA amidotransferase subunit A [Treponemataceae bacterium]|nr:aspartyl/glutamyl-tRNA amidotransferase subunit A [Treponemataceae bacterium]HOJ98607.1 amidase family protein [Termitinemataceae bacterium]HOM23843.1 amidase family protein [Termitinemataceae bacterium]HPP99893.1 amidase family protein [Termitinemataceae bacterium]